MKRNNKFNKYKYKDKIPLIPRTLTNQSLIEKEYRRLHLQVQKNAKVKHLFQELLANKTLNEGEYQGPALIGGNQTWWDGLLKNATFDIQDSQTCFFLSSRMILLCDSKQYWPNFEGEKLTRFWNWLLRESS